MGAATKKLAEKQMEKQFRHGKRIIKIDQDFQINV